MIAVLDYGIGNLRSAEKALLAAGGDARLVTDARDAGRASAVVLPGVGSFGACMNALRSSGLDAVVYDAVDRGLPFLGICVGMQMLFDASEESPGVAGLGVMKGQVVRLHSNIKVPQMQWNKVDVRRPSALLNAGDDSLWCYFVHSYTVAPADENVIVATCDYGGPVTAIVEQGNLTATQFHPEKSSLVGRQILQNFLRAAA